MLEPSRAGLTNTGSPNRSRSAGGDVVLSLAQHDAVGHRETGGGGDLLRVLLVHAQRAGRDAVADVRDPEALQHRLDGAVLPVGAVQRREHHVTPR